MSDGANQSDQAKQDALYEDREPKKIIRIITVTAYMVSVSFVGITLSAYYIFLWHPPNPRLMHSQAMASHSESQIGSLSDYESTGPLATRHQAIDLLEAQPPEEKLQMRRDIVKNVNAILRANFEKTRLASEAPELQPATWTQTNDSNAPNSSPLVNITESSSPVGESASTPENVEKTSLPSSDAPLSSEEPSTTTARRLTTRRPKSSGRKQHQTPFALKHLEVPIKQDGTRKRTVRPVTTTTRRPPTTLDTRGTSIDRTTPLALSTTDSSSANSSPQQYQANKSLYKTLTTLANQRDDDVTDLPVMPSISSDQFQAVPRGQDEDYSATIQPGDELMDD